MTSRIVNNKKTRSSLFAIVSAYLLYLSYGLVHDRHDTATTMTPIMRWLFIALFVAAAIGLGIYAYLLWKQGEREASLEQEPEEEEDLSQ